MIRMTHSVCCAAPTPPSMMMPITLSARGKSSLLAGHSAFTNILYLSSARTGSEEQLKLMKDHAWLPYMVKVRSLRSADARWDSCGPPIVSARHSGILLRSWPVATFDHILIRCDHSNPSQGGLYDACDLMPSPASAKIGLTSSSQHTAASCVF